MSTGINIAPSSGLTVGTTAVTSGTDGRVFFQAGGVVQQDANFTFDNTLKRLALKAVGTAGTDIPLSISNSAGTLNLFQVSGNSAYFNGPAATAFTPIFALYRNNSEVFRIDEYKSQFTGNVYMNSIVGPASSGITFQNQSGSGKLIHMVPTGGTLAIGYGTLTTAAALDVKSQGALSTDIAFRVRNSADSANIIEQRGDGNLVLNGNPARMTYSSGNNTGSITHHSRADSVVNLKHSFTFFQSGFNDGSQSTAPKLNMICADITSYGINNGFHWYFNNNLNPLDSERAMWLTPKKTLSFFSGTGPDAYTSKADSFELYSADIVGGNASPHFRTENGSIVKLYQETTGVTASTFVTNTSGILNDTATFDGYTMGQVVKALRNLGILA